MKKIFTALLLIIALISCETDVKFNNPSFQAKKDNNLLWKADVTQTTIVDGNFVLKAYKRFEVLTIIFPAPTEAITSDVPVTYNFGIDDAVAVNYDYTENTISLNYSTGTGRGLGQVTITNYNPTTKKISGNFNFNLIYNGADRVAISNINFQQGFIYNLQVQ